MDVIIVGCGNIRFNLLPPIVINIVNECFIININDFEIEFVKQTKKIYKKYIQLKTFKKSFRVFSGRSP